MIPFPAEPTVPEDHTATGTVHLRYEDVTQDGRLTLEALPHGLSVVWSRLMARDSAAAAARMDGVVPILSRMLLEGGDGPMGVVLPVSVRGCYELAHTVDARGEVDRILLNMWVHATAPRGRTYGPPPEGAGKPEFAGRVFAEHVFTRPFGPPGERKVLRLDAEGFDPVPATRHAFAPLEQALVLPEGATALDAEFVWDTAPIAFGLVHTDSNRHVNSLVYPRLFEDAALRRFAAHGLSTQVLSRRLEVAWRKPCFAGDRVRIALRAFRLGDQLGALGFFVPDAGDGPVPDPRAARPHAFVQTHFAREV